MIHKVEEHKVFTKIKRLPMPRTLNPYINQCPTEILERMYDAGSFTLGITTAETALVVPPPMFDEPAFLKAISTFRYIRWKNVKYQIQTAVSPFTYGWFGITGIPYATDGSYTQRDQYLSTDFGNLSHDDAVICDISAGDLFELSIPWSFNSEWLDIQNLASAGNSAFNPKAALTRLTSLKIFYLFQAINSLNSTIPATMGGFIFARLEGVEVAGPIYAAEPTPPQIRFQASQFVPGPGAVLGTAALGTTLAAGNAISSIAGAVSEGISYFMGDDDGVVGEPLTQQGGDAEDKNDAASVVPNVYGSMGYARSVNILGPGTMTLAERGVKHSIMGQLRKPSFWNLASITKTLTHADIALDPFTTPLSATSTDVGILRSCSRIRFFGNFFRMWRGSVNYSLVFISSPLVTWKLRIMISYTHSTAPVVGDVISQVLTIKGSTVYDFTIPYLYTNPWRALNDGANITDPTTNGRDVAPIMQITLATPPVSSGDRDPTLQVLVYQAAGADFQFASPKDPMFQSADDFRFQMKVDSLCKRDFVGSGSGKMPNYFADSVTMCEDLAKRWSVRTDESLLGPDPITQSLQNNFSYCTMDAIAMMFYYWHGQYKLKFQFEGPAPTDSYLSMSMVMDPVMFGSDYGRPLAPVANTPDPQRFNDGSHVISASLTQVMEVTVPFISNTEYLPVWKAAAYWDHETCYSGSSVGALIQVSEPHIYLIGADTSVPLQWVAAAAGNDFVFSYALPPPSAFSRWYDANSGSLSVATTADKSGIKSSVCQDGLNNSMSYRRLSKLLRASKESEKKPKSLKRRPILDLSMTEI